MRCQPFNPYPGYVYAFRVISGSYEDRAPTKIGFCHTKDGHDKDDVSYKRLADIQRHHFEELYRPFCSDEIFDANCVEYEIHCKYEKYRIKGEWFNLTLRQLKNIQKYLKQKE